MDNERYDVALAPCEDYSPERVRAAMSEALDAVGGLDWVKPGMRIAVKPNLVTFKKPDAAATTHPALLAELCERLTERGASVVIGDSPGGTYSQPLLSAVYSHTGMNALEREGVQINRDFSVAEAECAGGAVLKRFQYTAYLDGADAVICFAKLKTHGMMGMSGAVKNLFGVIPGTQKPEYHYRFPNVSDFANMLIDLNEHFKPSLCLMDAVWGMEGNGPTAGTPRRIGALMAARSPYALDLAAAELIGIDADELVTLRLAFERGLAPRSVRELRVSGDLEALKAEGFRVIPPQNLDFSDKFLILNGFIRSCLSPNPVLEPEECVRCGECGRICPANAIKPREGLPVIDRRACIHCFCCQEFCPKGAIKVKRPVIARILTK
ncbi:MAG: DUF362 domain-containing protein [Clostridia bacterium]|nr:DUF362 domain-containing protein [Clostridia bacterium]